MIKKNHNYLFKLRFMNCYHTDPKYFRNKTKKPYNLCNCIKGGVLIVPPKQKLFLARGLWWDMPVFDVVRISKLSSFLFHCHLFENFNKRKTNFIGPFIEMEYFKILLFWRKIKLCTNKGRFVTSWFIIYFLLAKQGSLLLIKKSFFLFGYLSLSRLIEDY